MIYGAVPVMGTATAATVSGAATAEKVFTVALRCGACNRLLGRAIVPPPPPFASLDWNVQKVLSAGISIISRRVPSFVADLLAAWRDAGDVIGAMPGDILFRDALSDVIRCTACSEHGPRYSRLLDS